MSQKRSKPARGNGTGSGITKLGGFIPENTTLTHTGQDAIATRWLARRLGVPLSTAGAIACANSWGIAG